MLQSSSVSVLCKHKRVVSNYRPESGLIKTQAVDCGDWRRCPACADKRTKRTWAMMFNEFAAVAEAAAGRPLRVLTMCLTLDKEYGARYGTPARKRLQTARNRINQSIRRWSDKLEAKGELKLVLYTAGYDLHDDSALHLHLVWVFRGSGELPDVWLHRLGRSQQAGTKLKRASRSYTARDIWGVAREGGIQWQWDYYHSGQELICAKTAAWYALKYALKSMENWDEIELQSREGERREGYKRQPGERYAYKGMRWADRGRQRLMRKLRENCGWQYRRPSGNVKVRHRSGQLITADGLTLTSSGKIVNMLSPPGHEWEVYYRQRWRSFSDYRSLVAAETHYQDRSAERAVLPVSAVIGLTRYYPLAHGAKVVKGNIWST